MRTALFVTAVSLATFVVACSSEDAKEPTGSQTANQRNSRCTRAPSGGSSHGGTGGQGGLSGGCTEAGSESLASVARDCWAKLGEKPTASQWAEVQKCLRSARPSGGGAGGWDGADGADGADDADTSWDDDAADTDADDFGDDLGGTPGTAGKGGRAVCAQNGVTYECVAKGSIGATCGARENFPPKSSADQDCRRIN